MADRHHQNQVTRPASTIDADVFGEHGSTAHSLGLSEIEIMGALRGDSVDPGRFPNAIKTLVGRALKQQSTGDEGYVTAVRYLSGVASALQGNHNFSPAQAAQVHICTLKGWQKHVAEVVGQTLYSGDDLLEFVGEAINHAELNGGALPPPTVRLVLHNALEMAKIEHPVPPTPQSSGAQSQELRRSRTGRVIEDTRMVDAGTPDDTVPVKPRTRSSTTTQPAASSRFSKSESFFLHHAMKAKKAATRGGWIQDTDRQQARQLAKAEWAKMDMQTRAKWDGMWAAVKRGESDWLNVASTAHLFRGGVATCVWSSAGSSSPAAEAKAAKESQHARAARPAVVPSPSTTTPSFFTEPYRTLPNPAHVSFLVLDATRVFNPAGLGKACRVTLSAAKRGDLVSLYGDHRIIGRNLFTIHWRDTKTARDFEGMIVKYGRFSARAHAYPEAAPQIFVAHMNHLRSPGIRVGAVHTSIAQAVPGMPFHLRHEHIGDNSTDTVWIAVFQQPPQLLRFTVDIATNGDKSRTVAFEPQMPSACCPVCRRAHTAVECEWLKRAGRRELKVKKGTASFLRKMPELV